MWGEPRFTVSDGSDPEISRFLNHGKSISTCLDLRQMWNRACQWHGSSAMKRQSVQIVVVSFLSAFNYDDCHAYSMRGSIGNGMPECYRPTASEHRLSCDKETPQ